MPLSRSEGMAGETKQTHAGSLKPGSYVIMGEAACVVKGVQTSRPGKHGHAKCRIEAMGVLDNKRRIEVYPAHENVFVPIIGKKNAQVVSVNGDKAMVMDMESYETFEVAIPEELQGQITEGAQVMYWEVLDAKIIKQVRGSS